MNPVKKTNIKNRLGWGYTSVGRVLASHPQHCKNSETQKSSNVLVPHWLIFEIGYSKY